MPMAVLAPVEWLASSRKDLKAFPDKVQNKIGYALYVAQRGSKHESAKPLGRLGAGLLEVVVDFDRSTFRAVYTVRFAQAVYVLHVFQKKAKRGISTPRHEIDVIRSRLKLAETHYLEKYGKDQDR
jgi:phage-related protein